MRAAEVLRPTLQHLCASVTTGAFRLPQGPLFWDAEPAGFRGTQGPAQLVHHVAQRRPLPPLIIWRTDRAELADRSLAPFSTETTFSLVLVGHGLLSVLRGPHPVTGGVICMDLATGSLHRTLTGEPYTGFPLWLLYQQRKTWEWCREHQCSPEETERIELLRNALVDYVWPTYDLSGSTSDEVADALVPFTASTPDSLRKWFNSGA